MPLKLFHFLEQFTNGAFVMNLTQFEKTGSMSRIFISLGNPEKLVTLSKLEIDHFFRDLNTSAVQ